MKILEIEIPVASCELSPLHITPFTNDERFLSIGKAFAESAVYPIPMVRPRGGMFEVFMYWDVIFEARERGLERIRVKYGDFSDDHVIAYGIVQQSEDLHLHWIHLARSLLNAKRSLKLNDTKLSRATSLLGPAKTIDRTRIGRLTKIATDLTPRLQQMAEVGRLSFTACRQLVTLPASKQLELASLAAERSLSEQKLLTIAFPDKSVGKLPAGSSGGLMVERKPMDTLRAENRISEKIGFPVEINIVPGSTSGTLDFTFFCKDDLVAVINKAVRATDRRAVLKGKISFTFENLDDFDLLTKSYFSEDD